MTHGCNLAPITEDLDLMRPVQVVDGLQHFLVFIPAAGIVPHDFHTFLRRLEDIKDEVYVNVPKVTS